MTPRLIINNWFRQHPDLNRTRPAVIELYVALVEAGIESDDAIAELRSLIYDVITLKEQKHALRPGHPKL